MRPTLFLAAALSTFATYTLAQAVPEGIAPDEKSPPGCKQTVDGNFTLGIAVPVGGGAKFRRETAVEATNAALEVSLEDGILRDPTNRIGAIVSNYQFQFDGPPQAGTIYTGGFSVCKNGSLALGGSTVWYRCMSGEFGNLYDRWIGAQCSPVGILASMVDLPEETSSSPSSSSVEPTSVRSSIKESASASTGKGKTTSDVKPTHVSSHGHASLTLATTNGTVTTATPTQHSSIITDKPNASISLNRETESDATTTAEGAGSTGAAALHTRVPGGQTFGAVVGIVGVVMLL